MKYLLDTNICIYLIKKKPEKVLKKLKTLNISDVANSVITVSELEYGVQKSKNQEQNKIALIEFLAPLVILSYTDKAAIEYGKLRAYLEATGKSIGSLDMLIAAHALSEHLTLITNNVKEFNLVPCLKIENWV